MATFGSPSCYLVRPYWRGSFIDNTKFPINIGTATNTNIIIKTNCFILYISAYGMDLGPNYMITK